MLTPNLRFGVQSCLCLAAFWSAVSGVQAGIYDAWNYRSKISFPQPVNGPLTNFPVLVVLSTGIRGFSYTEFQSSVGGDLRFADAGETWARMVQPLNLRAVRGHNENCCFAVDSRGPFSYTRVGFVVVKRVSR